jgi:hypothetical protein
MKGMIRVLAIASLLGLGAFGCEDEDERYLERSGEYVENRAEEERDEAAREVAAERNEAVDEMEAGVRGAGHSVEHGARRAADETGEAIGGAGRELEEHGRE